MRRARPSHLFASFAALLALAGCSGQPVKSMADERGPASDGSLTVVGWSLKDQAALAVQGVLKAEGGREVGAFDTHGDAAKGKTFEHLAPGHYRIQVTHRFFADRPIAAAASDEIDIQPGQHARSELAVDDRDATAAVEAGAKR